MTTWREFMSAEMKSRPAGTAPKDYMKTIATKWHKMKESSGEGIRKRKKVMENSDDEEDLGKTFEKGVRRVRRSRLVPARLPPYDDW